MKDDRVRDAVLHNLQIIGEAVKNLSEEFRIGHPEAELPKLKRHVDDLIVGGAR